MAFRFISQRFPLSWIVYALAVSVLFMEVNHAAVSMPFGDSWSIFAVLKKYMEESISIFGVFTILHNEHPYGLPYIIAFFFCRMFSYDLKSLALLSAVIYCLNAMIFLIMARKVVKNEFFLSAIVLISLSLRPFELLFESFEIGFTLTTFFAITAILAAFKSGRWGTPIAILSLILGGACSAQFVAVLPAVLLAFYWSRERLWAGIGSVLSIATIGFWVSLILPVASNTSRHHDVLAMIPMGLRLAGASIAPWGPWPLLLGIGIVGLFAVFSIRAVRSKSDDFRPMVCMGIFSLGVLALVAFGRAGMTVATQPRYLYFSVPLVIFAMVGTYIYVKQIRWFIPIAAILVYFEAGTSTYAQHPYYTQRDALIKVIQLEVQTLSDKEIGYLNPGPPELIRSLIGIFRKNNWSVFHESVEQRPQLFPVNQFSLNGRLVPTATTITVSGPGLAGVRLPCPQCAIRFRVSGINVPEPTGERIGSGGTRNAGIMFYDKNGVIIANRYQSLEAGTAPIDLLFVAPSGTTKAEPYVYAPSGKRVSFATASIAISGQAY